MTLLHKIVTGLIVALGCLHIGFTPFNYSQFDMDAIWFLSAGVAIILAGFLNVAVIRVGRDRVVRLLCVLTNASFALLFGVALFQMAQPRYCSAFALFGVACFCTLWRTNAKTQDSA